MGKNDIIEMLKHHENELRQSGVLHAAVFGSYARGEQKLESDIDSLDNIVLGTSPVKKSNL